MMREEADELRGDPRTVLMRTIEAAARRWYPWGVPRELFESAISEALAEGAQSDHVDERRATSEDAPSADTLPLSRESVASAKPAEHHLRAQFIVAGPLNEEEESLLFRAVTQGLHWQWDDVEVIFRDELSRVKTGAPIVACGVLEVLASLGGSVDHDRVSDGHVRFNGYDLIETVSLADALRSRDAKRQLWSHLQILLAIANEQE